MAKPTYIQHTALAKLITGTTWGHPIVPKTMRVLEREGWVKDGKVTDQGRQAHRDAMAEPQSVAHNANARTGVMLGELRDV